MLTNMLAKRLGCSFAASLRHAQATRSFGAFGAHRNTEDNMEESPFEFTEASY